MFSNWVFSLLALYPLLHVSNAQSCWRNTTCTGPDEPAFKGIWESNIYAPSSRSVAPKYFLSDDSLIPREYPGSVSLMNNGSQVFLDFGYEVGGIISLSWAANGTGQLGMAFTESKNWIGTWSDDSNGGEGRDGALYTNLTATNGHLISCTMPDAKLRGGFRYLTLFLVTDDIVSVGVSHVELEIGFQPTWANLKAYQGYFHSNDETLNKIWYSGAYTLQTNAVPTDFGRATPFPASGWNNTGYLGPGDTIIVDGAKRDRAVWPGDMGIAVPSTFVSIGDLDSVKNALQVMYDYQNPDGSFPEAGPPLLQQGSDTYHMWSMIGTYNYVLYSNDTGFLMKNWDKYLDAMEYMYGKVDSSGLLNVTGTRDWARWQQGFNNSQANMILYRTLQTGADLATWAGDTTGLSDTYLSRASGLKEAINNYCWDFSYGAFKDNATSTALHPQDANSMAVLFNVTPSDRAQNISERLLENWTPIGAVTPELPENISPFISSFEVQAHLAIGETARALELIRRCWGWYLNNPNGTQSTVIEGYLQNGTFGYRSNRGYRYDNSYISHAHGWSSGPTSSLTEYVLGLSVTGRAGETWSLKPQFGDLTHVEGGFMTPLGRFAAGWDVKDRGYNVSITTPVGTSGEVVVPDLEGGKAAQITVDGKVENFTAEKGGMRIWLDGGEYTITVESR
ncbi:Six-hairpin glycosidase-like protein [Pseudomassariella vexata]|uniref:Six-hairpin glycosidase-like protein n=1 Tax=Pseudomassariella vexata TaxID=1141098 RepID=A0A1Y2DQN0_9PEZI|nr:Six-hairpin glycosidase-like protein [Pseudomassariella vexata]ORY61527.1 Six-hairpin glycosidase-like protein [Pseudomassariella vexata]